MGGLREVSVLLLICFQSSPAKKPEPGPHGSPNVASGLRVAVRVYDGVNLSSREISRAKQEAEKIFRYAGIQLAWTTGLVSADVNDNTPSERWNPASLQLRIWPSAMAGKRPTSSETLGFCLSLENGDAVVLADAIQKRASFGTTNFADLLGLAMAHELGHLLLRSAAHSVTGIMRAQWTEKGLSDNDRGFVRFTPGEAESMRSEVRRRSLGSTVAGTSSPRTAPSEHSQPASYEKYLIQGTQLQQEGHYGEALAAYTAALDEVERQLGAEHISTAEILTNIGFLRLLQHNDSGANAAFERSLMIKEKALGPEHVQVGFTLLTIAMLTHKQGHYAAAEPLYRRALAILQNKLGPEHERTAFLEASMGKLYLAQGRNTEAEVLLEKAVPALENAGAPDEAILVVALNDLAEAYQRDGRYAKAEPLYTRVLTAVEQRPGIMKDEIRTGLRAYAQMLRKMKRKAEARKLELQLKTMLPNRSSLQ